MTNREWLFTLSDEQLADFMHCPTCRCCPYRKGKDCAFYHERIKKTGINANTCKARMVKWLKDRTEAVQ